MGAKQVAYVPCMGDTADRKGDKEGFLSCWLIWLRHCVILPMDAVRQIGIYEKSTDEEKICVSAS